MRALAATLLAGSLVLGSACADDPEPPPTPTVAPTPTGEPTTDPTATPTPTPAAPQARLEDVSMDAEVVARDLASPLGLLPIPGEDRLVVLERTGTVRAGTLDDLDVWLDIDGRVTLGGERGLLGLAFHPDFPSNRRVFVHYSGAQGRTTLSEFTAEPGGDADADTEQVLLTADQPASNHNGGTVTFGPDGMLYLALGDGGGADDRFGNGQRPDTILGTILRLDVSEPGEAAPAAGNPFLDGDEGDPRVWAYGLRNPFRIAFSEDQLYVADVGQRAVEELNVGPADEAGRNYGWPIQEGSRCFQSSGCQTDGLVQPVVEYGHDGGECGIIGGEVYTGDVAPLAGHYFYGDLCAGFIRSVRVEDGEVVEERDWTDDIGAVERIVSFGRDADGDLYVLTQGGQVIALVPQL